jgi:hypothetical protein
MFKKKAGIATSMIDARSLLSSISEVQLSDHVLNQPPFGEKISFNPVADSIKKQTYQQLGLQPRVIYAQDDLRGNGQVTDGFAIEKTDRVVFLVGPTYRKTPVSQWRLEMIEKLAPHLPPDTVLVIPEFKHRPFTDLVESRNTQLEWEHQWLERADVLAINLSLHWKNPDGSVGNIGPTTRFEAAYYFGKAKEKHLILFAPSHPQPDNLEWIYFHARDLGLTLHRSYADFYQALLTVCHKN